MDDINSKINDVESRNEWFETHWPQALAMAIGMSLQPRQIPVDKLMEALMHVISIVNDMRLVDKAQQAEIASLKACMQMKEK